MKRIIIEILIGLSLCLVIYLQATRIDNLKQERETHKHNVEVLMGDISRFKVRDSLNAAKVGELELKLSEFKKQRADDADIINDLKIKNKELVDITSVQTETILELKADVRDTTAKIKNIEYNVQHFSYSDNWLYFDGYILNDLVFKGQIRFKEYLKLVGNIKYRRFLFFKTKQIKNVEYNVISMNPYTQIERIEHIKIAK